jgi:hypothetical protein
VSPRDLEILFNFQCVVYAKVYWGRHGRLHASFTHIHSPTFPTVNMAFVVPTPVQFQFGSFDYFCNHVALPLCTLVGTNIAKEPKCYARNIDLGNSYLIFEPGMSDLYSNIMYACSCTGHDINNDFTHQIQIYSSG